MKITYGEDGINNSWQQKFPPEVECPRADCSGMARPAVNLFEESAEDSHVAQLHNNEVITGGDFWLHDAAAFQIYLCRACLKPITLCNQA